MPHAIHAEQSVRTRYSAAAKLPERALCCPVEYPPEFLEAIPREILERDYGCGDPTPFVKPGETVLDLGSGAGKLCYIAAQIVGAQGRVIGVDCNPEMLALARQHRAQFAKRVGFDNVVFRCGLIQDLELDLELLAQDVSDIRGAGVESLLEQRLTEQRLRSECPLVANDSIDSVLSNCVLNLVRLEDRQQLFREIFRVLKPGGRAAISDIVSDEDVPQHMKADPKLWSGCVSGAWREDEFLREFEQAGFHGIAVAKRQDEPWQTVDGVEFRSMTVVAYKGKQGPCFERNQAVIYRGPFKKVEDDDGHVYQRGRRMAVCDKTFRLLQQAPYEGAFIPVAPYEEVPPPSAVPFDCRRRVLRHPRETKGREYAATTEPAGPCCGPGDPCC
ncbi:MAG: methyltransferase domain-containing protein [Planctomycetia bacterium]|nr:methyltransferase domain-containing protein [Planctomycetia bacterium]